MIKNDMGHRKRKLMTMHKTDYESRKKVAEALLTLKIAFTYQYNDLKKTEKSAGKY